MIDKFSRFAVTMGSIMAGDSKVTSLWGQDAEEAEAHDLLEGYESDEDLEDLEDELADELAEEKEQMAAQRVAIARERRRLAAEKRALELAKEGLEEDEEKDEADAPPAASKTTTTPAERKPWSKAKVIGISVAVGTALGAAIAAGTVFWWSRRGRRTK